MIRESNPENLTARDPRQPEILHSAITQGSGSSRGTESLTTAIEDHNTHRAKERPQMESCTWSGKQPRKPDNLRSWPPTLRPPPRSWPPEILHSAIIQGSSSSRGSESLTTNKSHAKHHFFYFIFLFHFISFYSILFISKTETFCLIKSIFRNTFAMRSRIATSSSNDRKPQIRERKRRIAKPLTKFNFNSFLKIWK